LGESEKGEGRIKERCEEPNFPFEFLGFFDEEPTFSFEFPGFFDKEPVFSFEFPGYFDEQPNFPFEFPKYFEDLEATEYVEQSTDYEGPLMFINYFQEPEEVKLEEATPQLVLIGESLRTRTHSKGEGMMRKWISRPEHAKSQWSRRSEKTEKRAKTTHAWPKRRVRARMRGSRGRQHESWTHAWPLAYRTGSKRTSAKQRTTKVIGSSMQGSTKIKSSSKCEDTSDNWGSLVGRGVARDQARGG
ncbi:Unknown protein, partial [Striga hermonthica]